MIKIVRLFVKFSELRKISVVEALYFLDLENFLVQVKLKLKLTTFDIAHHSKGNPFQVCLTVSTL